MRAILDVTALCAPRPTGVGVYVRHLWDALRARPDLALRGLWNPSRLRRGRHRHLPPAVAQASGPRWPLLARRRAAADGAVLHGPDFRVPRWPGVPRVVTVHDLASFHPGYLPDDFAARTRARILALGGAGGADAVITPSRAVADELAARVPALAGRIHPVHHGGDHLRAPARPAPRPGDGPPTYLFVGNVERRKNVDGLLAGFGILAGRDPDARLVVVGQPGHGGDALLEALERSPAAARIERHAWLSPARLPGFYAGARALVFPTWYEGFGFPILEAMVHGCPVITSDRGATAEVAGDAALLVEPDRPEALADAMARLRDDDTLHADLAARGRARAAAFTWARCADETVAVYAAAAGS